MPAAARRAARGALRGGLRGRSGRRSSRCCCAASTGSAPSTRSASRAWTAIPFAVASYEREGRSRHALLTHAGDAGLAAALAGMGRLAPPPRRDGELVGDVFLWRPEGPGDAEANAAEMRAVLAGVALPRPFRRIVIAVGGPGRHAALHLPPGRGRRVRRGGASTATRTR